MTLSSLWKESPATRSDINNFNLLRGHPRGSTAPLSPVCTGNTRAHRRALTFSCRLCGEGGGAGAGAQFGQCSPTETHIVHNQKNYPN